MGEVNWGNAFSLKKTDSYIKKCLKPLEVPTTAPPTALGRESWITPISVSQLVTLAILRKLP